MILIYVDDKQIREEVARVDRLGEELIRSHEEDEEGLRGMVLEGIRGLERVGGVHLDRHGIYNSLAAHLLTYADLFGSGNRVVTSEEPHDRVSPVYRVNPESVAVILRELRGNAPFFPAKIPGPISLYLHRMGVEDEAEVGEWIKGWDWRRGRLLGTLEAARKDGVGVVYRPFWQPGGLSDVEIGESGVWRGKDGKEGRDAE